MANNFIPLKEVAGKILKEFIKIEKMRLSDPEEYERYTKQNREDAIRQQQNAPCHCCGRSHRG
jgi:hypothetical protein